MSEVLEFAKDRMSEMFKRALPKILGQNSVLSDKLRYVLQEDSSFFERHLHITLIEFAKHSAVIPRGWKITWDVVDMGIFRNVALYGPGRLELAHFLRFHPSLKDEKSVNGYKMVERAMGMGGLNLIQALHLFQDHNRKKIPKEWEKYYLIFPGTRIQNPVKDDYIFCMIHQGNNWFLRPTWLGDNYSDKFRLLRPQSK